MKHNELVPNKIIQSSVGLRLCSLMRNPLCLYWHCGLLCIIFGFRGMLVFIKEDHLMKRHGQNDHVGSEEQS